MAWPMHEVLGVLEQQLEAGLDGLDAAPIRRSRRSCSVARARRRSFRSRCDPSRPRRPRTGTPRLRPVPPTATRRATGAARRSSSSRQLGHGRPRRKQRGQRSKPTPRTGTGRRSSPASCSRARSSRPVPTTNDVSHFRWLTCTGMSRASADLDRLVDRAEQVGALAPDVRRVDAASARGFLCQRDDLVGLGIHAGHVDETGRQAEGARVHRLGDEPRASPSSSSVGRRRVARAPSRAHGPSRGRSRRRRARPAGRPRPAEELAERVEGQAVADARDRRPTHDASSAADDGGNGEAPQLPTTTVVTPWRMVEASSGTTKGAMSEWLCTSMKPGASTRSAARIVPAARPVRPSSGASRAMSGHATVADAHRCAVGGGAGAVDDRGVCDPQVEHGRIVARSRRCGTLYRSAEEHAERAPPPSRSSTQARPPCSSAKRRTSVSPTPTPGECIETSPGA